MSAPTTLNEAQREGEDTAPIRCVECGLYSDPDEIRHTATRRGPICDRCLPIEDEGGAA